MAVSTPRPGRPSCVPLPAFQDSPPSPLATTSSSPLPPFQNSLRLDLPVEAGSASPSKTPCLQDGPPRGIVALPHDPFQNPGSLDVFQWAAIDQTPRERNPSLPPALPVSHPNQGGANQESELYDLLGNLETAYFEPRSVSEEVEIGDLTISYCGDQTTFTDARTRERLTIYYVGDLPDARVRTMALNASSMGVSDLDC